MPKTWIVHLFIFTLQFVDIVGNRTQTKAGCYPHQFSTDPGGCNTTREKMYPKTFKTRNFKTLSQCHQLISSTALIGKRCEQCCDNLTILEEDKRTYELPAGALKIPGKDKRYKDFVTQCIGRQICTLGGKGSDRIQMDWNCIMFEYECVDDNQILNFTGDSTLKDSQVFLLHNQTTHSVNNSCNCVAYACQSSINVKLVGNTVNSSSCTLVVSEEGSSPAVFNCKDTITSNTLFQSNSSKIDITLNMTASVVTSDKGLLWIRVTASNGGNVSVACGSKIPSDVTQDCLKVTSTPPLVPTVMPAIADMSDTPTHGTRHAKTPSVTMISQTTESNIPIIGGVVGGLVAVLFLSAISFAIYKKCHKTNKVEDESALAANVDAPFNDLPKTPDSRRVWADFASGNGVAQGSPPAPFGAASHQMPRPTNSLPPIRHIDLKI